MPLKRLFFHSKTKEEMLNYCIVVIDTNFFLNTYKWSSMTTVEVLGILKKLSDINRLKIPYQVVIEYLTRRPTIIRDLIDICNNELSSLQKNSNVSKLFPIFSGQEYFKDIIASENMLNCGINHHKETLIELRNKLNILFDYDPILEQYEAIINKSIHGVYIEDEIKILKIEAEDRYCKNIPPGCRDNKKNECINDYIIWATILDIGKKFKKDVIFVTGPEKNNWVITDLNKKVLHARVELVHEFYEKCQKYFKIITPRELIEILKPDVKEETKVEL